MKLCLANAIMISALIIYTFFWRRDHGRCLCYELIIFSFIQDLNHEGMILFSCASYQASRHHYNMICNGDAGEDHYSEFYLQT